MARRRRKHDPLLAVALIRVSTRKQDLGPVAQRFAIETWAEHEGVAVAAWFEERGVSGGADPLHRPGVDAALAALDELRAGVLVVHERSRLARDVDLAGYFRTVARMHGAEVVATDASGSRLENRIKDVLSEQEREEIRKRTRRALAAKRRRGERLGGHVEYGYHVADDGRTLVEDKREQAALRLMRKLRDEGKTYQAICDTLTRRKYAPRGKAGEWYPMTVSRILARAG